MYSALCYLAFNLILTSDLIVCSQLKIIHDQWLVQVLVLTPSFEKATYIRKIFFFQKKRWKNKSTNIKGNSDLYTVLFWRIPVPQRLFLQEEILQLGTQLNLFKSFFQSLQQIQSIQVQLQLAIVHNRVMTDSHVYKLRNQDKLIFFFCMHFPSKQTQYIIAARLQISLPAIHLYINAT